MEGPENRPSALEVAVDLMEWTQGSIPLRLIARPIYQESLGFGRVTHNGYTQIPPQPELTA